MAQVYNHVIMPLTSPRDQVTQVVWGIKDFARRFRRQPEGMWLSETAVDVPTLEVLAAQRVAFTILAPHQAGPSPQAARRAPGPRSATGSSTPRSRTDAVYPVGDRLSSSSTTQASRGRSPSKVSSMTGPPSPRGSRALTDGGARHPRRPPTDGESYGHHHRFGEMALASALQGLTADGAVRLTNLGAYLAMHPPTGEVDIRERTSWSCPHGVERWRAGLWGPH